MILQIQLEKILSRIAIFGNSHVGAWRDAWQEMADANPGVEITFFSVPQKIHSRFRIMKTGQFAAWKISENECSRLIEINGRDHLQLEEFDRHLWVGANWEPEYAVMVAASGDFEGLETDTGSRPAYSKPFLNAIFERKAAEVLASSKVDLDHKIRPDLHGRPIYAETCQSSLHRLYDAWRLTAEMGKARIAFLDYYELVITRYFAKRGINFLPPPHNLRSDTGATNPKYLAFGGGLESLKQPEHRGDFSHMNKTYGAACLQRYLQLYCS